MTRRRIARALGVLALLLLAVAVAMLMYVSSASFQQRVRTMLVERLETATGGRVEFGNFRWSLSRMEFEVDDLTIHGLEPAGELPYLHADRLFVRARIVSFFERQISLSRLTIERPAVHLILGPRGISNQPSPRAGQDARSGLQRLFDVAVGHLEVRDGRLLLNDTVVPFSLTASDVSASVQYASGRFDGTLRAGELQTSYAPHLHSAVDVGFTLAADQLRLKTFRWASARSRVDASGVVDHLGNPKFDITYQASLDLQELGGLLRASEARSGTLELKGHGVYSSQDLVAEGKLALRNVEWRDSSLRIAGLNGGAQFTAGPDRLIFSHVFGAVFGGSVSGSSEIRNWKNLLRPREGPHPPVGVADLRFDSLQVGQIGMALASRWSPLGKLDLVGRSSGTLRLRWVASLALADAEFRMEVRPPEQVREGELPVTARLQAAYHGKQEVLEVSQFDLATRTSRVEAVGSLGSSVTDLHLAVNSTDISEFGPMLAIFGQGTLPARLNGQASFQGTVRGKLRSPSVTGHLQIRDFDSLLTASILGALPPGKSYEPAPIHWDELRADVALSSSEASARHGFLRRGNTRISFDSNATLSGWEFDRDSPLSIHARLVNVAMADVERFLARNDPVTGSLTMDLELSGNLNDLQGGGHAQVADLKLGPEQFESLGADLGFTGREMHLDRIVLRHDGALITGAAAYHLDTHAFRFQAAGRAIDLSRLQSVQTGKYKVAGSADFDLSGSGTTDVPAINGSAAIKHVVVNGEPVGDITATAVTRGTGLELKVRAHAAQASLDVEGTAQLRSDWPVDLRVNWRNFDIDPVLRAYLGDRITGHSSIAGSATVKGPLRSPRDLTINGTVDQVSAEIEKLRFRNPEDSPIRFALAGRVFTLQQSHLIAEDTDVITTGTVKIDGAHEMNLRTKGNVSMKLLQSLNPELRASGSTVFDITIGGTTDRPDVNGPAEIRNAAISFIDLPNGLSSVQGFLQFQHNRLVIESLAAQSGGGNLDVHGSIRYAGGLVFDLTAHSSEMRLRYPAGVSAIASMDLRYVGSIPDSRLSGTVTITRFALNSRFDFAQYLASAKQPESMVQPDSPLSNLHLEVHIVSASELQMQTSSAHLLGNVDLRLRGTAAHPVLLGRVNVLEGDITIAATKYHIDRGDVSFNNPTRIEPVLNVEATARIRDYDVSLGVHGVPPDHLRSSYRSDPPLPESDVIALLALGRTNEESRLSPQPTQNYTETASNAILGEALNETVSSRAQKLFGLGRIKIDPQAGGPESNPNARLTIEQQVSDKVTLTYITNLSQSAQQIIQVEYNVDRNFTIIAVRDQNGVLGFDVRYRRRKR